MPVEFVEILSEEPSAEAALRLLVPKILNQCAFEVYPHNGKADLLKKLPGLFAGYGIRRRNDPWFRDCCRAAVLVDRDQQECHSLKLEMETNAQTAGLTTRARAGGGAYFLVTRVAIEELEAWFFGDWEAVRAAYPKVSATIPQQAGYRDPDAIASPWEALERILQRARYFPGGLRKIEAARAIATHMDPERNVSPSFCAFREVLKEMASL